MQRAWDGEKQEITEGGGGEILKGDVDKNAV